MRIKTLPILRTQETQGPTKNNILAFSRAYQRSRDTHHRFLVSIGVVLGKVEFTLHSTPVRIGEAVVKPLHAYPVVPNWSHNFPDATSPTVLPR